MVKFPFPFPFQYSKIGFIPIPIPGKSNRNEIRNDHSRNGGMHSGMGMIIPTPDPCLVPTRTFGKRPLWELFSEKADIWE